jgi:integrase
LRLADGTRKDVLLGPFGSAESKAEYERVLGELRAVPAAARTTDPSGGASVNEVLAAFWDHATAHYRRPDGTPTNELNEFRLAFRPAKELYGHTPAREFGPLALRCVRQKLVDSGLCRGVVNARVRRIRHAFRWAASQELVPVAVYQALATVAGLQRGRSGVREAKPVSPVAAAHVEAVLPVLRPEVRAMVELQRLTGMRPGEVCRLRPCDLDTSGPVWFYAPADHKNAWRGKARTVAVGPKAQAVLAGLTPPDPGGYYFSPARAVAEFHAGRSESRQTPRYPSHMRRNREKRVRRPTRPPAERYTTASYGKAVARGCREADREARREADREARREALESAATPEEVEAITATVYVPTWSPNQLRHSFATEVRRKFGLEAAQVLLGHERADVTQVYAEKNAALAAQVAAEIG